MNDIQTKVEFDWEEQPVENQNATILKLFRRKKVRALSGEWFVVELDYLDDQGEWRNMSNPLNVMKPMYRTNC